jgi:hypothetical protein
MKPHPRIRKTIKWGGAAVTLLLVVVWIGARRWYGGICRLPTFCCYTGAGQVRVGWDEPWSIRPAIKEWHTFHQSTLPFKWWFNGYRTRYSMGAAAGTTRTAVDIPIWFLAAVTGGLSAIAWRLDRRGSSAGHCPKCNYDRTGIAADAKCPECGH